MRKPSRTRGVLIGLAIVLAAMPIAVVATIAALPVWSWLETATGVESIGHSGPAAWCYMVTYVGGWLPALRCFGIENAVMGALKQVMA